VKDRAEKGELEKLTNKYEENLLQLKLLTSKKVHLVLL
jgi:hypothetical protein